MSDSEAEIDDVPDETVDEADDGFANAEDEEEYDSDEAADVPAPNADDEEADTDVEADDEDEATAEAETARVQSRADAETFAVIDRPGFGRAETEHVEEVRVVPPDERRTSHALSTFELTEIISVRTAQISASGATGAMIEVPPGVSSAREIAILELKARRCPLKVMRNVGRITLPGGKIARYVEFWSPNEM